MKFLFAALLTFLITLMLQMANAAPANKEIAAEDKWPTVNILQWWGYISSTDPYIENIEKTCHVSISYDQYDSNNEFLRRMESRPDHYDIIIFSDTILEVISKSIANNNSSLYKLSRNYYPIVKQMYEDDRLPHNIVFFLHSLTGFLYNPEVISLNEDDNIFEMFKKAKGKTVVMLDDPVEAEFLLSLGIREAQQSKAKFIQRLNLVPLTINNFKRLYDGTNFMITNLPERIATKQNFAFAFQWSGDAIGILKNSNEKLKFFIHPRLSYVTSDLLAALNNKKTTMCVANALGGEWFLQHEQNKTYYFSPYVNGDSITDDYFKTVFDDWKEKLPALPWVISVDQEQFKILVSQWDRIKLNIEEENK